MTFLPALYTPPHITENARQQSDVCQTQFISLVPRQNCGVFNSRFLPSTSDMLPREIVLAVIIYLASGFTE